MGTADCHIHTDFSDGLHPPHEVVETAARKGLSVIAITDHDTIEGVLRAQEHARRRPELGVEVVVGEEISTLNGHVLGLFLKEYIPPRLSAQRTVEWIHRQGGLAVLPHPFHLYVGRVKGHPRAAKLFDAIPFDGVETLSQADVLSFWGNRQAQALARLHPVAELGNSDAHDKEFVGMAVTEFEGRGAEDLKEALRTLSTKARILRGWTPRALWRHARGSRAILRRFNALNPDSKEEILAC